MRLRIDELAQKVGITSRNIRAYQAQKLLPPPELEGRTGWYTQEHVDRLELIGDLQERGFSLAAIRATFRAWEQGGGLTQLIGIRNFFNNPMDTETPQRWTRDELEKLFEVDRSDRDDFLSRAVEVGVLDALPDGNYEARSPMVVEVAAELVRDGIPLPDLLDEVEPLRAEVAPIADRFIRLVDEHLLWKFEDPSVSPAEIEETVAALHRLRPVATEIVRPFLADELTRAIEERLAEHMKRQRDQDRDAAGKGADEDASAEASGAGLVDRVRSVVAETPRPRGRKPRRSTGR
ncbi:MAG TPA: MerR family transcriptional regulator [Nitriliruptorales bacterium]